MQKNPPSCVKKYEQVPKGSSFVYSFNALYQKPCSPSQWPLNKIQGYIRQTSTAKLEGCPRGRGGEFLKNSTCSESPHLRKAENDCNRVQRYWPPTEATQYQIFWATVRPGPSNPVLTVLQKKFRVRSRSSSLAKIELC